MDNKEKFLQICKNYIRRDGIDDLLQWLEKSDFFYAPASRNFHGNHEGGLLEHSLYVYDFLIKIVNMTELKDKFSDETLAIVALFHDICKVNFYKKGTQNVKYAETGRWYTKEVYEFNEKVPLGHGEKSCILLQQFMRLSIEELLSIRWHMGGYDAATRGGDWSMNSAKDHSKLVTLLQVADTIATLFETKVE